jgi:ribosomal protein RSM22 (predicted rRNA methylase)
MDLPPSLREAIEHVLEGVSLASLTAASNALTQRYRDEIRDGRPHLDSLEAARAYVAARMPACFAAVAASLSAVREARPEISPASLLDVGAGPGTALWAASVTWPSLANATLIEASPVIRALGEELANHLRGPRVIWQTEDLTKGLVECISHDIVILSYALGELQSVARATVTDRLWDLTRHVLVIVEPGTTAGWQRILTARTQLIGAGAHVIAPCPHADACPIAEPDWCHFAQRIPRSRIHRETKGGTVPWEDEKFIYLAAARSVGAPLGARVIAHPQKASGRISLKLCQPDGSVAQQVVTRRDGEVYKQARQAQWGDVVRL